jgi:hypothetical protein
LAFPKNKLFAFKPENEKGTTILIKCHKKNKKRSWVFQKNKKQKKTTAIGVGISFFKMPCHLWRKNSARIVGLLFIPKINNKMISIIFAEQMSHRYGMYFVGNPKSP